MKRQGVINSLIEYDLDSIFSHKPERSIREMLELGNKGYADFSDSDLISHYKDIFEEDITIEEDLPALNEYGVALVKAIKNIKNYIIDSEMGGSVDREDSYYPCLEALNDLNEKIINENVID